MLNWIDSSEWLYGSKTINMRQHHAGGALNLPNMVFQHFEVFIFRYNPFNTFL